MLTENSVHASASVKSNVFHCNACYATRASENDEIELAKRAQQHWDSGLFSDCHYHSMQLVQAKATELLYTIKVDGDKLTPPHQQGESHDFLMWRVNRLLPGDGKGCGTAVGVGQKSDTYGKSKHKVMITPGGAIESSFPFHSLYDATLEQIARKRYNDGQFSVDDCELLEKSDQQIDGVQLGKYKLATYDERTYNSSTLYDDMDLLMLGQMSEGSNQCDLNGYWAPVNKHY
ncbi:hypothetical protein X801_07464, partial [Opisthorchis viverrini]